VRSDSKDQDKSTGEDLLARLAVLDGAARKARRKYKTLSSMHLKPKADKTEKKKKSKADRSVKVNNIDDYDDE
jgi:hypothetical protein